MPTLTFQTLDAKKKASPFVHGLLQVLETPPKSKKALVVFSAPLDGAGRVRIPERRKAKEGKQAEVLTRTLRLVDLDGEVLLEQAFDADAKDLPPITVDARNVVAKLKGSIGDGKAVLGVALKKAVLERLKAKKITSLVDLRGKHADLVDGLKKAEREQVERLSAHADLHAVVRDPAVRNTIIDTGIAHPFAITRIPAHLFVKRMAGTMSAKAATELHTRANGYMQLLANADVERRIMLVNGFRVKNAKEPPPPALEKCDCQSVLTPLSYLADLLDYAVTNMTYRGAELALGTLEQHFLQPFGALPTDCDAWQQLVRQVRLCIEVVRAKARITPALRTQVVQAIQTYAAEAYQQLLLELGTSSQELRALRSSTPEEQARTAASLGIAPAHLNSLIFQADDGVIERVFGLQAIQRDPLSTGVVVNDATGQLLHWQLHGVSWNKTTDVNGRVYVTLVKSGQKHVVSLYKDAARSILLAKGESTARSATVELTPVPGGDLKGRIQFNYSANNSALEIAAIPELVAWRLAALHARWPVEDHPVSAFDALPAIPLVDPDQLTEADFMRPFGGSTNQNAAHRLFLDRKRELEAYRTLLDLDIGIPRSISDVIAKAGLSTGGWAALHGDLTGKDAAKVQQRIGELEALQLKPEHFVFLFTLLAKENANEAVLDAERQQCLDVLVRREKHFRLFAQWRSQERAPSPVISLDGRFFRYALEEPALDPIRSDAASRAQWRYELERNSARAIIGPDLFPKDTDRAHSWMVSGEANELLRLRRTHIEKTENALRSELTAIRGLGSEDNRRTRFNNLLRSGDRSVGGEVVFHALGFASNQEIVAVREAIAAKRPLPVDPGQYGLTVGELVLMLELRTLVIAGNSDAQDLEQVMHLLVRAEKRRWLDPLWREEERTKGILVSPVHLRVPASFPALREWLHGRSPAFVAIRDDARARRDILATLEARLEQERSCAVGVQTAIDRVEERTLPALRDALVSLTVPDANGADLIAKKSWVTNNLLIDAHEGGCRKTTRVGQAIETLQLLIWGRRTGFFENTDFHIAMDPEVFEADWKWLGNYSTWRSAMFVFLYPEDFMRPTLNQEEDVIHKTLIDVMAGIITLEADEAQEAGDDGTSDDPLDSHNENDVFIAAIKEELLQKLDGTDPLTEAGAHILVKNAILTRFKVRTHLSTVQEEVVHATPYWYRDRRWANIWMTRSVGLAGDTRWLSWLNLDHEINDRMNLPIQAGLMMQSQGKYESALGFYRSVFDDVKNEFHPRIEELLASRNGSYDRTMAWLQDPLNPFAIAATRQGAVKRYILITVLKCILEYAESEFTKDTAESLAKARELYDRAYCLMANEFIAQQLLDGQSAVGRLTTMIGDPEWIAYDLGLITDRYGDLDHFEAHEDIRKIRELLENGGGRPPGLNGFRDLLDQVSGPRVELALEQRIHFSVQIQQLAYASNPAPNFMAGNTVAFAAMGVRPQDVLTGPITGQGGYWTRPPRYTFCIPPNPLLIGFRLRVEMGLFKLRNCMNIAGMKREVPVYAAATDNRSGMPVIALAVPS
jgi:hypothetical protein